MRKYSRVVIGFLLESNIEGVIERVFFDDHRILVPSIMDQKVVEQIRKLPPIPVYRYRKYPPWDVPLLLCDDSTVLGGVNVQGELGGQVVLEEGVHAPAYPLDF